MSEKYILYLGSGGLVHMLTGLFLCIEYAKSENRILVIDTLKASAFKNNISSYFNIKENIKIQENYDSIINEKYKNVNIKDIKSSGISLNKSIYMICGINLNELPKNSSEKVIVYCGCGGVSRITKNIYVKNNIINDLKNIINNKLNNNLKKYLSIHFRNTDRKSNINEFIKIINNNKELLRKNNIKNIFLATDDFNAFNCFNDILGKDFKLFKVCEIKNCNGGNIHYGESNKKKLMYDILIDIYLILKSNFFIPSLQSSVSQWIIKMLNGKFNIFNIKTDCIVLQ